MRPCIKMAITHSRGLPNRVFQIDLKGSFLSLQRIHAGTLKKNANNQASSHEIGIESSHPSHCASDIPNSRRAVSAEGTIRLTTVGASLPIWAYSVGISATVFFEISQILPEDGSST